MGEPAELNAKLSLSDAREEFLSILRRMNDEENLKKLLSWIQWNWLNSCTPPGNRESPADVLSAIADDIRGNLPPDAVLPSETIVTPTVGPNADCDPRRTVHVDSFLYDDSMVDKLCEEGQIPRSYCLQCGSNKTLPLNYISHSASKERIACIFNALLPPIDNKVVLDVGSRLGAILYGAFLYTKASKIIGVEMNSDFCKLQREIVKKYGFQDRVEVIQDNIINRSDVVQAADVVIMNNVFEFFMDMEHQVAVWSFLHQSVRKGSILVSMPPLDEALADLPTNINLSEWVQEIPPYNEEAPDIPDLTEELSSMKQYLVL